MDALLDFQDPVELLQRILSSCYGPRVKLALV
jgi:hypothetical protein